MNQDNTYIEDEQFERRLKHAVHLEERERIRSFIDDLEHQFHQETQPEAVVRPIQSRKWFLMAASFLLLAAAYLTFQTLSGPTATSVAQTYYEPYPNGYEPVVRSSNTTASNETLALSAYEAGNYQEALRRFSTISEPNENIRLFMAICEIETNDLDKASETLKSLRQDVPNTNILYNPIEWYSGILLLMQGDQDNAKPYFERLAALKNDSIHSRDAIKLLKELYG